MKPTPAGKLRHRVTIQSLTDVVTASGATSETWVTVVTVWASVEYVRGREILRGHVIHGDSTHLITLRHRAGITRKHRILWGVRVFDIIDIDNPEQLNVDMLVHAVERDA